MISAEQAVVDEAFEASSGLVDPAWSRWDVVDVEARVPLSTRNVGILCERVVADQVRVEIVGNLTVDLGGSRPLCWTRRTG